MSGRRHALLIAVVVAAGAAAIWWNQPPPPARHNAAAPAVPTAPAPIERPPAEARPEALIQHPLDLPATKPPIAAADTGAALAGLLGRQAVTTFFQLDDFPRRFVATVDNLGHAHAPPMAWPIHPTPDRFTVEQREGGTVMAAGNSLRYTPLVLLAERISATHTVDLYLRLYPLLQQAYEDLGYPKRYFNDRLIAVMDQLLATPDAAYPLKVQLTEVKGSVPSVQPWVRYELTDPALQALAAGQKMLLRVGPDNQRRLKARLTAIRQELLSRGPRP